ncbi:MAG: MoaD/ThiS family protein [Candidatus Hadarchaeum sp.]|uniref:MoaD/ThiS family protein n=1 Tax=Candidatus Hadarchaeum sp. TaxID=2883567 RepID=UPI003171A6F2
MKMALMKVKVKFYTRIKEFTGEPQTIVELKENSTVLDLMKKLSEKYGKPFEEYVLDPKHGIKPYIKVIAKTAEPGKELKDGSSVSVLLDTDAFLKGRKEVEIYPIIGGGGSYLTFFSKRQ